MTDADLRPTWRLSLTDSELVELACRIASAALEELDEIDVDVPSAAGEIWHVLREPFESDSDGRPLVTSAAWEIAGILGGYEPPPIDAHPADRLCWPGLELAIQVGEDYLEDLTYVPVEKEASSK